jgi:chitinase
MIFLRYLCVRVVHYQLSIMKNILFYISTLCMLALLPISCATEQQVAKTSIIQWQLAQPIPLKDRVIVAYVTNWTSVMPDPEYLTHVNYGFGHVNATFDGIRVENPVRLRQIALMRVKYPHLKILLSIGGWQGSDGFSEMAMLPELREKFAIDCRKVIDAYNLDGIDLDWEYPTIASPRTSASPYDKENFTLLVRAVRAAIGTKKLLTMTSLAVAKGVNFPEVIEYVNFVNIMSYDMGIPPYHHATLYRSPISSEHTVDDAIMAHFAAGLPNYKMVLGVSFYGEGLGNADKTPDFEKIQQYVLLGKVSKLEGYQIKWDDIGKVPYLADNNGYLVFGYENPASVALKTNYAIEHNLLGVMCWEYAGDSRQKYLTQTINRILKRKNNSQYIHPIPDPVPVSPSPPKKNVRRP